MYNKQVYFIEISKLEKDIILTITKDTRVFDILENHGDIEDVMEAMGIKSVGRYSLRRVITRFLSVEKAAEINKKPLDEFLVTLNKAVDQKK